MKFSKYQYQEAKAFLGDAELISQTCSPCVSHRKYRKPDGTEWSEVQSHLESPEDDYSLSKID